MSPESPFRLTGVRTLARRDRTRRPAASLKASPSIESLVQNVRGLWIAAEGADEGERAKLKQDIMETVDRLKGRIERRLSKPVAEPLFFDASGAQTQPETQSAAPSSLPRFAEPALRVCTKDLAEHALSSRRRDPGR